MSTSESQPVVCTLTTKEAAQRTLRWTDLHRQALAVEPIEHGAAMTLPRSLGDALEALVAQERSCCAFLTITTRTIDDTVRVEITSANPDGRPVAHTLAGLPGS